MAVGQNPNGQRWSGHGTGHPAGRFHQEIEGRTGEGPLRSRLLRGVTPQPILQPILEAKLPAVGRMCKVTGAAAMSKTMGKVKGPHPTGSSIGI